MKVSYFKEEMSLVCMFLRGWRRVYYEELNSKSWIVLLRAAVVRLTVLADELERDVASAGE